MNKLWLLALGAAVVWSGCRRSELGVEESDENTIRFSTETTSKSTPVDSDNGLPDMGVFCSATGFDAWSASSHTPNKMFNTKLTNSNYGVSGQTSSAWDYAVASEKQYWGTGLGSRFTFFAYAPYASPTQGVSIASPASKQGVPEIKYVAPLDVTQRPDLMVAEQRENIHPVSAVGLKMHHALSALTFSAKLPEGVTQTITVKTITIQHAQYEGTLPLAHPLVWEVDYHELKERHITVSTSNMLTDVELDRSMQSITQAGKALFMLPQLMDATAINSALTPISLAVVFEVDGELYETSFDMGGLPDWQAGKAYDYQITYAPGNRTFDLAMSVVDWDEKLSLNGDVEGTYLKATERTMTAYIAQENRLFYSTDYTGAVGLAQVSGQGTLTIAKVSGANRFTLYADQLGEYKVKLTAGRLSTEVEVTVVEEPLYIKINNLYWATGNLVATAGGPVASGTNGSNVRIGCRRDGGLYFQFGSLIGWKGGTDGRGEGMPSQSDGRYWNGTSWGWSDDAMVWPSTMLGTPPSWPQNATTNQWYFGLENRWSTMGQDIRDYSGFVLGSLSNVGVGDPCTYYLGVNWRLPTTYEYNALCNNYEGTDWVAWSAAGGSWKTTPTYGGNFVSNQLFFPASGARNTSNGSFLEVAARGYCWSSSVNKAKEGEHFSFHQQYGAIPRNHNVRSRALPVRCVADELSVDQTTVVIPLSGGSVTVNVVAMVGWTATEGVGTSAVTVTPQAGGAGTTSLTLTMAPSATLQRGTVLVSGGGRKITIKVVQVDAVAVGNVAWAKGNLVAASATAGGAGRGGCEIGAPGDGGLYFQFGSLIGYKGGNQANNGTGVGMPQSPLTTDWTYWNGSGFTWASEAMVWPSEMTTTPSAWANNNGTTAGDRNTVVGEWYFNYNAAPYSTVGQDFRDYPGFASGDLSNGGVGDPCTYYLGGGWRLPTANEYLPLCNNQGAGGGSVSWAAGGGSWAASPTVGGNFVSNQLFFPASGCRYHSNGSFNGVTAYGYYWSNTVYNAPHGYYCSFGQSNGVIPLNKNNRSLAFPIRCVMDL